MCQIVQIIPLLPPGNTSSITQNTNLSVLKNVDHEVGIDDLDHDLYPNLPSTSVRVYIYIYFALRQCIVHVPVRQN